MLLIVGFSCYFGCKGGSSRTRSRRHRTHCNLQYFGLFKGRKCSFSAEAEFYIILAREDMAHLFSSHLLRFFGRKPVASNRSLDLDKWGDDTVKSEPLTSLD